jgi:methyl-accepting chemotaxis protein
MFSSVKGRIVFGFGIVILLLIVATIINVTLVSGISTDFDRFRSALGRKSQAVETDLVMTKVRVRVNQWLRSMNPAFAKQADELLVQDSALVAQAAQLAVTDKEKQTVADIDRALKAYIESWRVIQGLYADEAKIYNDRIVAPGAGIRGDLAKLRDGDALDQPTSRLIGEARDGFMSSESLALQYRISMKQADADQLAATIKASLAALERAAPAIKAAPASEFLKQATSGITTWRDAFSEAIKVGQARVARLNSWTANEGEAMAVGSNILRAEGEAATAEAQSSIVSTISRTGTMLYALSLVIVLIGIALSWRLAVSITRPLANMVQVLKRLAANDRALEIPETNRRDEIGQIAKAAQVFRDSMMESARLRLAQSEDEKIKDARQEKITRAIGAFESSVGKIVGVVAASSTGLQAAATTLTSTAEMTQRLSANVASASEQASANVQSVASATEEMTSSVNEISRQVQESSKIASEAVRQAEKTDGRINQLSQAAGRIGDVVKLITAIAEQTNLLALNATIEAARAGEAGRGFAVVASEVKQLASQTAKATEEIGTQIAGMQSATQEAVTSIKEISQTIGRISEIASTISVAVEEQGAATQEIARNVGEAAKGTGQVATSITDVNRGANETGAASAQVLASAQSLSTESSHLKLEVEKFLVTVRAA